MLNISTSWLGERAMMVMEDGETPLGVKLMFEGSKEDVSEILVCDGRAKDKPHHHPTI